MIIIKKAIQKDVEGISEVCSEGYRDTYAETHSKQYIERIIEEFYNHDRILGEINNPGKGWGGWFVALDGKQVVGAIGGGMISTT
ncbi:MAG: GNAT family N-acetyltransferase, partial [Anaerobacillus sp.]